MTLSVTLRYNHQLAVGSVSQVREEGALSLSRSMGTTLAQAAVAKNLVGSVKGNCLNLVPEMFNADP